ncbi:CobW family GTP-binding protein [Actinoplanes sp. RD1]|uniref:CobW family GTP-binding protein n=1 Tax=Actinoplanes sp. RD1 TaxID=3064538 RepID=UPI0027411BD5|nr:GTP-binding protein [Actinoplanes sp. RD1]
MTDDPDVRSRVTVLAGFSPAATEAVTRALLAGSDRRLLVVSHDLSGVREGLVHRTVRTAAGVLDSGLTELVHGCVSCTLREDVLPTLVRLSRQHPGDDLLLALPPAVEPEAVATAAAHTVVDGTAVLNAVRFDSFVTVVEATALLGDLATTDDLRDRDLHAAAADDRAVADVVSRQIEFADTLVLWGTATAEAALLQHLAPWAALVRIGERTEVDCRALAARVLRTARHDPGVPGMPERALQGYPIGIHEPAGPHGVTALLFHSRRPFHPQRLNDALDDLTGEALRGRGQLWIASQGDTAIAFESAGGGLRLGSLGPWLAALPRERWSEAAPMRRLAADAGWDPYYGDRRTVLSFVGFGLDTEALTALLTACLLTDAEIAEGEAAWRRLPDPFAGCFPAAVAAGT